jgi:hypothetical protein
MLDCANDILTRPSLHSPDRQNVKGVLRAAMSFLRIQAQHLKWFEQHSLRRHRVP